jgi:hypothetical protein
VKLKSDIIATERDIREKVKALKDELTKRILSLPENPHAKPVGRNAFVMTFAHIGHKWGPEYHNFRTQYELLADVVEHAESPLSAIMRLRRMLRDKRIVTGNMTCHLHPTVIDCVRKALAA